MDTAKAKEFIFLNLWNDEFYDVLFTKTWKKLSDE